MFTLTVRMPGTTTAVGIPVVPNDPMTSRDNKSQRRADER